MIVNEITEPFPGHFSAVLDFPRPDDAKRLVNASVPYVWLSGYQQAGSTWQPYSGELLGAKAPPGVRIRYMTADFLMETAQFIELPDELRHTIHLIQVHEPPAHYLELRRYRGKTKYEMLQRAGYYLELVIPGATDFASVVSTDRAAVARAIAIISA